VNKLVHLAFK